MHKYAGMSVEEILRLKKGSIKNAPLPSGSPDWSDLTDMIWEEVDAQSREDAAGFKAIRKLLTDQRFDK